eukprot:3912212-Rhodomonas_salina.1
MRWVAGEWNGEERGYRSGGHECEGVRLLLGDNGGDATEMEKEVGAWWKGCAGMGGDRGLVVCGWQSSNRIGHDGAAKLAEALPILGQLKRLWLVCGRGREGGNGGNVGSDIESQAWRESEEAGLEVVTRGGRCCLV